LLRNDTTGEFAMEGVLPSCSESCFPFSVKAVYSSAKEIEVEKTYTYGGGAIAQVCEDAIEAIKCSDLEISKLPGYKLVLGFNSQTQFPIYTYINKYAMSPSNNKIYFLYRVLSEGKSKAGWVYDDPLVIISFNTQTRDVVLEGQIGIIGMNVEDIHISPSGLSLIIVDAKNPRSLPANSMSNIVVYNFDKKSTKIFETVGGGAVLNFITWINDKQFLYNEYKSNQESTIPTVFRIGTID
jgi:hypothetical protein